MDTSALLGGLVLNFMTALLIGLGLLGISGRVVDFASRAKVAVIIALAATLFGRIGEPIYWHHDWGHFIYLFVADLVSLGAAALIVAWMLPADRRAPADAPTEV
jgi:ABC-type Co2+ transport system permease subunit